MSSNKQYIKILTKDLKHRGYQWKFGLNELSPYEIFNNINECTSNALYICEIKDFFKWISLYRNTSYVGYVTIPEDAKIVTMEDKIKTNKVILNEPLIHLVEFIDIAINNGANIHFENDLALRLASHNGHLEVVKYLISRGANVHARNDLALRHASDNVHLDIVECLIANGRLATSWRCRCTCR